jgi:peptidoglycan/LPS O-acetylase OafA/YrhL
MRADGGPGLAYQPGLDGLRGVAVAAVLVFHAGLTLDGDVLAEGGFLGVSTFFTLSGFLITSLLLTERRATGGVALGRFWSRRLRRLMPAALATLALAIAYGALVATDPGQLARLRGDLLAALFYVANWRFIFSDQSYADLFATPSPVLHFWSLAIEEQFYLFYPLVVAGVLGAARGSRRAFAVALVVLTVLSVGLMIGLYHGDVSLSRLYYSTGTRAAEMLVGALLAIWATSRNARLSAPISSSAATTSLCCGLSRRFTAWPACVPVSCAQNPRS